MPHDGLCEIASATVVEEISVSVNSLLQTDAPQWGSTPLIASCQTAHIMIIQANVHDFRAHVVQKEIAIGMNGLVAEPG